jgi:hypothetical protein
MAGRSPTSHPSRTSASCEARPTWRRSATRRLARNSSEVNLTTRAELTANVEQATRAEGVALVLFAALAALAARR